MKTLDAIINSLTAANADDQAVAAQRQWLRDRTVPLDYLRSQAGSFTNVESAIAAALAAAQPVPQGREAKPAQPLPTDKK